MPAVVAPAALSLSSDVATGVGAPDVHLDLRSQEDVQRHKVTSDARWVFVIFAFVSLISPHNELDSYSLF
jgi:hypothetical protein